MNNTFFSKDHEWINFDNQSKTAKIGITDFAQNSLGDIVFVELPEIGSTFKKGESFGVVESIKSVSDIYTPTDIKIINVNTTLSDEPQKINEDANNNWIIEVEVEGELDTSSLFNEEQYKNYCENG